MLAYSVVEIDEIISWGKIIQKYVTILLLIVFLRLNFDRIFVEVKFQQNIIISCFVNEQPLDFLKASWLDIENPVGQFYKNNFLFVQAAEGVVVKP